MKSLSIRSGVSAIDLARLNRFFHSIGFRILAFYALLFTLSFVIVFAFVYWIATNALAGEAKDEVLEEVASVQSRYQQFGPAEALEDVRAELDSPRGMRRYYLLAGPGGHIVAANMARTSPFAGWKIFPVVPGLVLPVHDSESDEHSFVAYGTRMSDGGFLVIGYDSHFIIEVQETIIMAFGWSAGFMLVIAFFGGLFFSVRLMRRIEQFNTVLNAIGQGQIGTRVALRGRDDELDVLAGGINAMLDRIQTLLESLRQVTTDIAHDLRTPLSQLRQRLEPATRKAVSVDQYEHTISSAITAIDDILLTFEALLRIAQIEAGLRRSSFTKLDMSSLCDRLVAAYRAVAEDLAQSLTANIEAGVHVEGDRDLLTQLGANLIENAIRHSSSGASIELALCKREDVVEFTVSDTGPGIPMHERQNVFRRFYRLERSRTMPGSGLGMALVKAVADLHAARIVLEDNHPGLRVRVLFAAEQPGS
jgi:signal transduction histidine kinase